MFCGMPGTGIHATRLFGYAFWDMLATVVAAFLIDKLAFHSRHFFATLAALVLIAIVVHKKLGINTRLNDKIFGGAPKM
jgi:hypothetical protein